MTSRRSVLGNILSRSSRTPVDCSGPSSVRPELAAEQDIHRIVSRLRSGVVPAMRSPVSGDMDFDVSTADRAISFKRLEAFYSSSSSLSSKYPSFDLFLSAVQHGDVKFAKSVPASNKRRSSDVPKDRRASDKKASETSAVVAEVVAALSKRERASSSADT